MCPWDKKGLSLDTLLLSAGGLHGCAIGQPGR